LLEAKADTNATDEAGCTALLRAAEHGHELCTRALVEANASLDVQNVEGDTALMRACYGAHALCARVLIEAKASLNVQNEDGCTALMFAHMMFAHSRAGPFGQEWCARALIKAGANLDKQCTEGFTALMLASQEGWHLRAQALIEAGADVRVHNCYRTCAWTMAKRLGHIKCANVIRNFRKLRRAHLWKVARQMVYTRRVVNYWLGLTEYLYSQDQKRVQARP
jgi:ankyrin repeat protein